MHHRRADDQVDGEHKQGKQDRITGQVLAGSNCSIQEHRYHQAKAGGEEECKFYRAERFCPDGPQCVLDDTGVPDGENHDHKKSPTGLAQHNLHSVNTPRGDTIYCTCLCQSTSRKVRFSFLVPLPTGVRNQETE